MFDDIGKELIIETLDKEEGKRSSLFRLLFRGREAGYSILWTVGSDLHVLVPEFASFIIVDGWSGFGEFLL